MLVYVATTFSRAKAIFQAGFTDLIEIDGLYGVSVAFEALDSNFRGEVTVCLDVPVDLFEQYLRQTKAVQAERSYPFAIIPAEVLNRLGRPQLYDHFYAGVARVELLRSIRECDMEGIEADEWGPDEQREERDALGLRDAEGSRGEAQEMRHAVEFLDQINGWRIPLAARPGMHEDET